MLNRASEYEPGDAGETQDERYGGYSNEHGASLALYRPK
jgi:hypothetical protein